MLKIVKDSVLKVTRCFGYDIVPLRDMKERDFSVHLRELLTRLDVDGVAPQRYLGPLGGMGLTAWAGLLEAAALRPGDVVWVSAAAGAVGGLAAQIAKLRGHTVIGSAGSDAKVRFLLEHPGLDGAFDYRSGDVGELLRAAAPDGIDVYFDNVGGEQLEAALFALRRSGRVALCGAISVYNATEAPPGIRNLGLAVGATKGFGVSMALGAFLAGMVVGRSEFSLRAATDALPMRDAFAVLFFVSVGMLFDPAALVRSPGLVAAERLATKLALPDPSVVTVVEPR